MTSTYNDAGIVLDRYADILAVLHTLAKAQWGESVDLEKDSYYGHILDLIARLQGEINELLQDVYDGRDINNATGVALDAAVSFIGLERQAAAKSTVTLTLTAAQAATVPAGSKYKVLLTGVTFETDSELIFSGAGSDTVTATCTVNGAFNAAIGEIDTIVTSVAGITGVNNTAAAVPGRLQATDSELKASHTLAVETSGENDVASIYEALLQVTGVSAVFIFENDTIATIGAVPSKNIYVVVIGGSDLDVATAIDDNKTSGVPTYGTDENVSVYNSTTNQTKIINFDRGATVSVYIKMTITKVAGVFPDDGENTIKEGMATLYADKGLNDDSIYNEHWGPIFAVPGVSINSLFTGLASSPSGTSDLPMTAKQQPSLDITRDTEGALTAINVEIVTA